MYEVRKKMEIAGSHQLNLPYESKCENLHGHNWLVTIYIKAEELEHDMVVDFKHIKNEIEDALDHHHINDVVQCNPTAENIAKWICDKVNLMRKGINCYRVDVEESHNNIAIYYNEVM